MRNYFRFVFLNPKSMDNNKALLNMNTEDFNTMRSMLNEIELKIIQLDPLKQKKFYQPIQTMIYEAWKDTCNPTDAFLYSTKNIMKNSGTIFEVIEGTYKDKFFVSINADQLEHFTKENKLLGTIYSDYYCKDKLRGNVIISVTKLKQIGFSN